MKKTVLKKSIFLMAVAFFVISFANVAVSGEDIEKTKTIKGSIIAISAETGEVEVKDESGQTVGLKAGSDINLDTFNEGQWVTVECSDEGLIKNMNEETQ